MRQMVRDEYNNVYYTRFVTNIGSYIHKTFYVPSALTPQCPRDLY